jgi:phosphoserine phosphatase
VIRIAAFDLDGTVLDCESQMLFVRYLVRQRLAPASLRLEVAFWFALDRLGWKLEVSKIHDRLLARYARIPRAALLGAVEEFTATTLMPRIRPEAARWMTRLREQGCHVVLLSASPLVMVTLVAASLPADGCTATQVILDRPGALPVEGEMVYGEAKLRALQRYAAQRFPEWRLEYAFGNDYADRFLLAAADNPVAVCASPRLRAVAAQRGWSQAIW